MQLCGDAGENAKNGRVNKKTNHIKSNRSRVFNNDGDNMLCTHTVRHTVYGTHGRSVVSSRYYYYSSGRITTAEASTVTIGGEGGDTKKKKQNKIKREYENLRARANAINSIMSRVHVRKKTAAEIAWGFLIYDVLNARTAAHTATPPPPYSVQSE